MEKICFTFPLTQRYVIDEKNNLNENAMVKLQPLTANENEESINSGAFQNANEKIAFEMDERETRQRGGTMLAWKLLINIRFDYDAPSCRKLTVWRALTACTRSQSQHGTRMNCALKTQVVIFQLWFYFRSFVRCRVRISCANTYHFSFSTKILMLY